MTEPVVPPGPSPPPSFSPPLTFRYTNMCDVVDRVHCLFARWEREETFQPPLDVAALHQLKLAVHEWLSNLIQHANFAGREPEFGLAFARNGKQVWCAIDDNSHGFDLNAQLSARSEILEAFPERGMGLLMIKACTKQLSYRQLSDYTHRLEFVVSAEQDPWLNIPF